MSNSEEAASDLVAEITSDPVLNVFFVAAKTGWQMYYACHAKMLQHLELTRPEMSIDDRVALVTRAVSALQLAARQKPPTARQLHTTLRDICLPLLKELGINETELEDLKDDDDTETGDGAA